MPDQTFACIRWQLSGWLCVAVGLLIVGCGRDGQQKTGGKPGLSAAQKAAIAECEKLIKDLIEIDNKKADLLEKSTTKKERMEIKLKYAALEEQSSKLIAAYQEKPPEAREAAEAALKQQREDALARLQKAKQIPLK